MVVLLLTAALAGRADLRVDTDTLAVGQSVGLHLTVADATPQKVPQIQGSDSLDVSFVGQSQTTRLAGGTMERQVHFRYNVLARQVGTHSIGPIDVQVHDVKAGSATLRASPIQLTVTEPVAGSPGASGTFEASTRIDPESAWQGQIVMYQRKLAARSDVQSVGWQGDPNEGLRQPRDGAPERRTYTLRDSDGSTTIDELNVPLVVTGAGTLRFDPPAVAVDHIPAEGRRGTGLFRFFRETRRDLVTADPMSVKVRPLPEPPPGFSGLVGDLRLLQSLQPRRAKVGDSVTWELQLDGAADLAGFVLPTPDVPDGARIYADGRQGGAQVRQGRYRAISSHRFTVVPTQAGELELPPVEVIVFSPRRGDYQTLTTDGIRLRVDPGEDEDLGLQSFAPEPGLLDALTRQDEGPVFRVGPRQRLPWLEALPAALGLAALPTVAALLLSLLTTLRASLTARRSTDTPPPPSHSLRALPADPDGQLHLLDAALTSAVALATQQSPGRMVLAEALDALPTALAEEVRSAAADLAKARFGGGVPSPDLADRVRDLVSRLEVL